MGMRVDGRVCAGVAIVLVGAWATAAQAADKLPRRGEAIPEADEGPAKKGGGLRLGALAGVGFPRPLTIEALIGLERALALGLEYGFMPPSTIGGVDMTLSSVAAD